MGYTEKTLTTNEKIIYRGKKHWRIYLKSIICLSFLLMSLVTLPTNKAIMGYKEIILFSSLMWASLAIIFALHSFIIYSTSEFIITNKRVILKIGHNTTDILLSKIEAFNVYQGFLGSILNYGTLIISGTGSSKKGFKRVADPFNFKKIIQTEIENYQ